MDLPGPIHDFLLVFLGASLILGGLGIVYKCSLLLNYSNLFGCAKIE